MRGKWALVTLTLILFLVTACEGGTSGSVVGSRQSCTHRMDTGSCKGSYRKLSGTYGEDIENDRISYGAAIRVKAEISVESGTLRASVESPEGEVSSVQATPGQPAILEGVAKGSVQEFVVRFQAVDSQVAGVSYEIVYEIP